MKSTGSETVKGAPQKRKNGHQKKLSESQFRKVRDALAQHEKMKGAYFWRPPGTASSRRSMEALAARDLSFKRGGRVYRYTCRLDVSCKHVYYRGEFSLNGEKKNRSLFARLIPAPEGS